MNEESLSAIRLAFSERASTMSCASPCMCAKSWLASTRLNAAPKPMPSRTAPLQPGFASLPTAGTRRSTERCLSFPSRERRILEYPDGEPRPPRHEDQNLQLRLRPVRRRSDENVIESHISKLRKRLRNRLGLDPIDFPAIRPPGSFRTDFHSIR